jgi:hypothetical protein
MDDSVSEEECLREYRMGAASAVHRGHPSFTDPEHLAT